MIKKSGAILLAMLYTITAAGFALNLHYCGNHVASVKINAPAKGCGKLSSESKKMNCCKDTRFDVKVKDSHESQSSSFLSKVFAIGLPRFNAIDDLFDSFRSIEDQATDSSPPDKPLQQISTFLKNCIFRI